MLANLRPTLRRVFVFSLAGLSLSLALLFYLVLDGSQRTILRSAERYRDSISRQAVQAVTSYLMEAPAAAAHFDKMTRNGLVDLKSADSIQAGLFSLLLANDHISEASFTFGDSLGYDRGGNIQLDRASVGQVAVFRMTAGDSVTSRRIRFDGKGFVAGVKNLSGDGSGPAPAEGPIADPSSHATFQTPAEERFKGRLLWTDLHWSQLDDALPEARRRVELSVQEALLDSGGRFLGVLRIGLFKQNIDGAVRVPIPTPANQKDPHLIFLCDKDGRLITGFGGPGEHIGESGGDLRVLGAPPAPVAAALKMPALKTVLPGKSIAGSFREGGLTYLCTFRALPEGQTQDWVVGIVVPQDFYSGALQQIRRQILWWSVALMGAVILAGGLIVHGIDRAHSMILRETSRMKAFEFSPGATTSRLRDVGDVLEGLEKAKTAMRSMSKYVPVDLVRRLYHEGREPVLGGESVELSVLFTDIKEFTPFAERMPPDELAGILGAYLQVMATVIQGEKGTIDKFIGDAVMAFWNAPEEVADHPAQACRAALRCREALAKLYDSPEWRGAPRFETRFALHRCVASVGHFGAPDRFNYTAIGDGINLASRLEGLNKQYGTAVIASETIHAAAKDAFVFRLLDRVAVKGKTEGIAIYELVSERVSGEPLSADLARYEQAFEAFQRGDFKTALALLETLSEDPPSRVLADRCRVYMKHPPATGWTGIHSFDTK